jgi:protein ImuB
MLWIALQAWSEEAQPVPELSQALAWQALAFTPRVALARDAALMEVSASLRLFGGLRDLLVQLQAGAHDLVQPGRLHAAPGPTSLVALGRLRLAQPWKAVVRWPASDLPLEVLDAAGPHLDVLDRLGCRVWGDVRRLPRDGLARRLGAALLDALDEALGERPESQSWLQLPEVFEDRLELPLGVTHSTGLLFALQRLLQRLKVWLLARSLGVLGVRLAWQMDTRRGVDREGELLLRQGEPTQDTAHITRLAAEHLARVQLPAPAQVLSLRSLETVALDLQSRSLLHDEQRQGESLGQLLERLEARLGSAQIQCWQPADRHEPERMQQWLPAQPRAGLTLHRSKSAVRARPPTRASSGSDAASEMGAGSASDAGAIDEAQLLPTWLLPQPQPLRLQGDRPCYPDPLALLVGPQRLELYGWAAGGTEQGGAAGPSAPVLRDYFIARSAQAGLLWIYRERGPHAPAVWYLQGIFA